MKTYVDPQVNDGEPWIAITFYDKRDDGTVVKNVTHVRMYVWWDKERVGQAMYWPIWCPNCMMNHVVHAFEYLVRCANGKYEAWCEVCSRYFEYAPKPASKLCLWLFMD